MFNELINKVSKGEFFISQADIQKSKRYIPDAYYKKYEDETLQFSLHSSKGISKFS